MLTITHTHEAGTLIDGTAKGDGTAAILKANRWRWGRSIGTWYMPNSRDHRPNLPAIARTAHALEEAGHQVATEVDTATRSTAEVEAGKIARQADRAAGLDAKADRSAASSDAAWDRAQAAFRRLPEGGEPIHVGHHSEGRHRNAIAKADTAMRRSIEASADAERARGRAEAAARTTDARYAVGTVANRIEKLGAEIRKTERELNGHTTSGLYGQTFPPASGARADELRARLAESQDALGYWEGVREAQIEAGTATNYDRTTIAKGDHINTGRTWYEVERVNAKSVTVRVHWHENYSTTDTVPYAHIRGHRKANAA